MRKEILILFLLCLTFCSCRQTEKSNVVLSRAIEIFLSNKNERVKVDSSMLLTEEALKLDNKNIQALNHKSTLLFLSKDVDGLIKVADELLSLRPQSVYFLMKKSIYLELAGRESEANVLYSKVSRMYKENIEQDSKNFDLRLSYLGFVKDTSQRSRMLEEMKSMLWNDSQKHILESWKENMIPRQKLFDYWNGNIEYDQINERE